MRTSGNFVPHYEAYADHQKEIHNLIDQLPVPNGSEAFESEGDNQIGGLNQGPPNFAPYSGSNATISSSEMSGGEYELSQRLPAQPFYQNQNREQESKKLRRPGFLNFRKPEMLHSRLSVGGADDSDCSGSLTPGQMNKWSRRHIVQEGASIFPKVQAPSVDLTLNDGITKKTGGGPQFNNSSDTLSPLATLRVPHSLLSQQFGSAQISPRDGSMGGEIEQHFVGALRRAQESLDSVEDMKRPESPLSLTPSPSSASKLDLDSASKWLFSPGLKNNADILTDGAGAIPQAHHLQSIQESERQRLPSSEGPQYVSQSGQSHIPPSHFQSCDTLGPMPSFGEEAIYSNEGSKLGAQVSSHYIKRPGSAFSRSTSKDGAGNLLPPINSSAFPPLNISESGIRQSQQSGFSEQNQIRFYEEQMQALRFRVSEARIQSEVALREKATSEARLLEKQSQVNILEKKLVREEEKCISLEEHVGLLEQKFNFPSKLALLRGQALENARSELKELRQYLHNKDRTISGLQDQIADLRTQDERKIEPWVRELETLSLECQRKEIVLQSLTQKVKELQRETSLRDKEREEMKKRAENEIQRTQQENGELRLMMEEADQQIKQRETQLQTLKEAARRADQISEQLRDIEHKHQDEKSELEKELEEAKDELAKVRENDYNYERITQKNARQFDYEAASMREQFQNKLGKAREEADDLKIQRDRLLEEIDSLREKNQALSEEVTTLALMAPDEEGKVLKLPAETQTEKEQSVLEAQFDELVRLLYEGEGEQEREEWLIRVHEDVKRARELEDEITRLKSRDSNASSSDFTHKLLIQRDKQIEALKTELARYQQLPGQVEEMQRYNEQLALSNQQLEMQMLSHSSLQVQSPNATGFPSLPEMRVLEEVAHSTAELASALGLESISLTSLAKEGANHLAVHSLSGTSVKDSRQLQFQQNPEHAKMWGQRIARELKEVLTHAEKAIKLKTTEASEAKRLLKQAKKAAASIQTEEAVSGEVESIKEKDREIGQLKAEVSRLEGLLREQLGRSRGVYSQRGSPFTTPLTSRLEKEDERLEKALFGSKVEEKKDEVADELEGEDQGTLIPFKTPRTARQVEKKECLLETLDFIISEVQEGSKKIEVEEEIENQILRRIVSMKKNIEFRVTCALEEMVEEVRGAPASGRYKTVEEVVEELRHALIELREKLESQMQEGELQGRQETLEEMKETAQKLFKLEELANTTNVFTLMQSMKQQIEGEREEQWEQAQQEMTQQIDTLREEWMQKMNHLTQQHQEQRSEWIQEKEAIRKEREDEYKRGWGELQERKNTEIKEAVTLKSEEMEARMESEAHRLLASKRTQMERQFLDQRKVLEARQKERISELERREQEKYQKLESQFKESEEKGRVAELARQKDREERFAERKEQLERTYQAKMEAVKSERETMEQQLRFTLSQEHSNAIDQKEYLLKKSQDELADAKAKLAYQEQKMSEMQRTVTSLTKQIERSRKKTRVPPTGSSGATSARGGSGSESLQMEVLELKEQLEKERKRAKQEMKSVNEKHRADLRRIQTEKENVKKRVESACELKVKKMQQELDEKSVELEMQRQSGERDIEREIARLKKEQSTELQQKEKQLREQTEKQVNKMKREMRQQITAREEELRQQIQQEQSAITAEAECKLEEMKQQYEQIKRENERNKSELGEYLKEDESVIPNERSLYEKHEEGIRSADERKGDQLKSLQERMNTMMQKMEETVQRRCEQSKKQERQRSLEKMKKARVFIVEDAFEKFAELLNIVLERLNQQMRAEPPSPNRSLLDDDQYELKITSALKSLGLTVGATRPSIGELAVRQVEQKVTSLLLSAKEILTLQFQEEKDTLYEQVAGLEKELAQKEDAIQMIQENSRNEEEEMQVKQGASAIKVLKEFQSPSDTLEVAPKGAGLQERDLTSEENYPVNLKQSKEEINETQFLKKLVGDLLLMADTFIQILAEPDNAASLRGVAVWLKKETKKLRKRSMSAISKYQSVFNLLAKSVLEIKRALVSASQEAITGPRREEIVRLRMQNLDLHQKVCQLQTQLRQMYKRERESNSSVGCKFEQSMSESGASTMTRLLHNPELLSPDQTLNLLKNVMAQATNDETLLNLLKESPEFSLFLDQLHLPHIAHDPAELGCSDQTLKQEADFRHEFEESELDYSEGAGTSRFGDVYENSVGTALGAGAALAREIQHERMDSISEVQNSVNQIYGAMAAKRSSFS